MLFAAVLSTALFTAPAAEDVDELLARAARLAELGQQTVAAGVFGQALSQRSLEGDLLAQQKAARAVLSFLGDDPEPSWLAGVLGNLPAKQNGVFVSAHGLARVLAFEAVATGDYLIGLELDDALKTHTKLRHAGEAADSFALVGESLSKLARFEGGAAIKPLQKAFKQMIAEGWQEAAVHVGTELAAQLVQRNKPDDAGDVIATLATGFSGGGDLRLLRRWCDLVDGRLSEVPSSVLVAHQALLSYLPDDTPSQALDEPAGEAPDAGDDDPGAAAPNDPTSAVIAALSGRRAVQLLSVERDDRVLIVKSPLGQGLELHVDIAAGVVIFDHEGVVFALDGAGVTVLAIEQHVLRTAPQPPSVLPPGHATYLLADGETFSLDSQGGIKLR